MNPTPRILDARGLPCPQPVILAKNALAAGDVDALEILVDNAAARENLTKFAAYAHCAVECAQGEAGEIRVLLRPSGPVPGPAPQPSPAVPAAAGAATVLITSDGIGSASPELAHLLMRGFLFTLTECDAPPARIIFMNAGVRLALEGSDSLEHLRKAAGRGVDVIACGTCLEYLGVTEALGVGRISNMYEIATHLLQGPTVHLG
ncbi:sulfurtransferase-like selenium metabolism protein YedF [Mesoterricola silvestris]|uniref:Sulfurtransferase-like selenium metabolism protein YedF n=1 Tax=Mesoterricola silvestris TaxID=2927979 RepID=A0AA48GNZ8_9BACT|nr:sulfurtransferase-like selenium metabolism protein YedF [Mesoterricola silvestris]BDU74922.1 sulfurtransferase-like selenium metabolism protein YedF [Mesoterricola silvestris]